MRFAIHEHKASKHHFDFRLEVDGTLKSWAIPRGPSTDPRELRLAIRTEDRPVDYEDVEGMIPVGKYGAGTVIVWDCGTCRNVTRDRDTVVPVRRALREGHIVVELDGKKISGAYALQRVGQPDDSDWLFVKVDNEKADRVRQRLSLASARPRPAAR